MVAPAVSCIVPTLDRADKHPALYEVFRSQKYDGPLEMLVLDESKTPSRFFLGLRDARVRYWHIPGKPRDGGVTRIGSARNWLVNEARGDVIVHFDDDDNYDGAYVRTMVSRLISSRAHLVKLAVWRCLHEASRQVFQWDTTRMGGRHFALRGTDAPGTVDVPASGQDSDIADAYRYGFGFSYVFWKNLWDRFRFPEEGTEDWSWLRKVREVGGRIHEVMDQPGLVLHTVHERSGSMLFPQVRLGVGASPESFVVGMRELPRGQDVVVEPGVRYAVLAAVNAKYSLRELTTRAGAWGVTVIEARDSVVPGAWGAAAPPAGYRLVFAKALSSRGARLPWSVPAPLSFFDKSRVERAWKA